MTVAQQALAVARTEIDGSADEQARIAAWDRLHDMLSTLDSKTSVLLRFNAIVVAALAYLLVISGTDPLMKTNATVKVVGQFVGHASLLAAVLSCGFAFSVINVEWQFFGGRLDGLAGGGRASPAWSASPPCLCDGACPYRLISPFSTGTQRPPTLARMPSAPRRAVQASRLGRPISTPWVTS